MWYKLPQIIFLQEVLYYEKRIKENGDTGSSAGIAMQ